MRLACLAIAACLLVAPPLAAQDGPRHGLSTFGELKYPAGFRHFDYVNPAAPKGGEIRTWEIDTFDNFNPLILRGVAAAGSDRRQGPDWLYESLMTRSLDEPDAMYGLLAESVELGPGRAWAAFNLSARARFNDGTPVTSADVAFTFNAAIKDGNPRYKLQFEGIESIAAEGPRRVVFHFKPGEGRRDLPLQVAEMPILPAAFFKDRDFTRTLTEPPPSSGPYRMERAELGRTIVYRRDPNWWGRDLPVNVGRYNFDVIRHEYFRDRDIAAEAFFAGEYDFRVDVTARHWAQMYDGRPAVQQGFIRREELRDGTPSGVQAFFLNTRRDKFKDIKVREALNLAFDFEWQNKNLFFGLYRRMRSMFENSDLAATGLPGPAELALLEPHRATLPPRVFTAEFQSNVNDASGNLREPLRRAQALLAEAGWTVKDRRLVNATGEQFSIEFMMFEPSFQRIVEPYIQNLARLGIKAEMRMIDLTAWRNRERQYDFDIITRRYGMADTPGAELRQFFGSAAADIQGMYNIAGIKNPAVDALIEQVVAAKSRADMETAVRALDRVLMWNFHVVPHWYSGLVRLATWDRFGRPAQQPRYQSSSTLIELMWTDAEKEKRLPPRPRTGAAP